MGREVQTGARLGAICAQVKAHLDSELLQLRGGLRADLRFAELAAVRVEDGRLLAETPQGALELHLGEREATLWCQRIQAPPSLADKLGLKTGVSARRLGPEDAEIDLLIAPFLADPSTLPQVFLLALHTTEDLDLLASCLTDWPAGAVLWTLRLKGKQAAISETALRTAANAAGWVATKTARFSESRSADRWHRKK